MSANGHLGLWFFHNKLSALNFPQTQKAFISGLKNIQEKKNSINARKHYERNINLIIYTQNVMSSYPKCYDI